MHNDIEVDLAEDFELTKHQKRKIPKFDDEPTFFVFPENDKNTENPKVDIKNINLKDLDLSN